MLFGYGEALPLPLPELAVRLAAAVLLGGLLGIERELRAKPLGLRTFMVTALGAAAFAVLALTLLEKVETEAERSMLDLSRVVEGIITASASSAPARSSITGATSRARRPAPASGWQVRSVRSP